VRRLAPLAALALAAGCFGGVTPEGKYYCANQNGCLQGFVCYQNYCCRQDQVTGLCADDPCLVSGTDADHDGFFVSCGELDCDDNDSTVYPGAAEVCDHKDNNCNGQIDEGVSVTLFMDRDGDGHGDPNSPVQVCPQDSLTGLAKVGDDCNDSDPTVYGGAPELCDGKDNNCNGEIDEGALLSWYKDADGDGYGVTSNFLLSCTRPVGYAALKDDCDDTSPYVHPGATEECNGVDDNCNGLIDEGVTVSVWPDGDGDGYGAAGSMPALLCAPGANQSLNDRDCNDANPAIHPGAPELCNGVDDNCNGVIDEGVKQTFWPDADGDGFGDKSAAPQSSCTAPAGWVANNGDCDDTRPAVNPSAGEVCNGLDDNCNGLVDEGLKHTYFKDNDADGYGDAAQPKVECLAPAGYVENPLDCNDGDASIYPGAPELCDAKDNDCDGVKDNSPLCGPRVDQAELAATWSAGYSTGNTAPAGCLAGAAGTTALAPARDTAQFAAVGANAASIKVVDALPRGFFAAFPQGKNAGWKLTSQVLTFYLQRSPVPVGSAFGQPLVLFCQSDGAWARYEPGFSAGGATFTAVRVTVPVGAPGGWTFGGGFTFAGSTVNWVEVHFNNGGAGDATVWLDDVRFEPQ
jgi:hypothetical protein